MLFLAISLGFFVENLREYNVERHREKEYINSLIDIDMTLSIFKKNIFNLYKTIDLQKQTFDLKTHSKYELEKSGVKYLLVYDELKLAQFRNIIYLFQNACRYNVMREKKIKAHAIRVIDILKKEYHLD